jgi:hypothetical protein
MRNVKIKCIMSSSMTVATIIVGSMLNTCSLVKEQNSLRHSLVKLKNSNLL